jgi:rRNA-processing protein FCF1
LASSTDKPLKVILDANFLFIPSQFNVDIFEELENLLNQRFEPILLSSTQEELEGLAKSESPKTQKQALLALKLAEKCRYAIVKKGLNETYDDVILRVASEWNYLVATNDIELKKRLRVRKIPVIFLRQKRHLAMDGIAL